MDKGQRTIGRAWSISIAAASLLATAISIVAIGE